MKTIKSLKILEEVITSDLGWRKKELTNIIFDYKKASDKQKDYYWRVGVIMLYSHWEGFIKNVATNYLSYIVFKGYKLSALKENFFIVFMQQNKKNFNSNKYNTYEDLVSFVNNKEQNFDINPEATIDTGSNLNYAVLLEILLQLNIDKKEFELRNHYIENLIKFRNMIAHGEALSNTENLFSLIDAKTEILQLMETFRNIVINESSNGSYLIKTNDLVHQ